MITLIISIMLLILLIFISIKFQNKEILIASTTFSIFLTIYIIIHFICLFTVKYNYETFIKERNIFELSLAESRANNNTIESSGILIEIIEWNKKLVVKQYENTTFYYDQFTDDRFNDLNFIK